MKERSAAIALHRPRRPEAGTRPLARRVVGAVGQPGCGRRSHRAGDPKMLPAPPDPRMSSPGEKPPRTTPCAVAKNEPWPEGCVPVAAEGVARGPGRPRGERRLQRGSTEREARPVTKLAIVTLVGVGHPTDFFGGRGWILADAPKDGKSANRQVRRSPGGTTPPDSKQILGNAPSTRPAHLEAYRIWAWCFGVLQEDPLWNKTTSSTPRSRPSWSELKQAQSSSTIQQRHWLRCELRMDRRDIARSRLAGCPGSPRTPRLGWLYRTQGCGHLQTNSEWHRQKRIRRMLTGGIDMPKHAKSANRQVRWSPGGPNPPDSKQILGNAPSTRRTHLEAYRISVRYSVLQEDPACHKSSISIRTPVDLVALAANGINLELECRPLSVLRLQGVSEGRSAESTGRGQGVWSFRGSRDGAGVAGHVPADGRKTNCELRPPGPQKVRVDDGRCRAAVPWGWPFTGRR